MKTPGAAQATNFGSPRLRAEWVASAIPGTQVQNQNQNFMEAALR